MNELDDTLNYIIRYVHIYRYLDAAVNFNSVEFCGINLLTQLTQIRLG